MFEVTNGVKQGGVMSPILFAVYVKDVDTSDHIFELISF